MSELEAQAVAVPESALAPFAAGAASRASYLPAPARIAAIREECADTRTFGISLTGRARLAPFGPGQFVFLSLPGHGEAAFTIAEADVPGELCLTVRRIGRLTTALFALDVGAAVGLRGPFGRGFAPWPRGARVAFVAGGCGLVPLRRAIEAHLADPTRTAPVTIVYGARDPSTRIYREALERWRRTAGTVVVEGVEQVPAWPVRPGEWAGARGSAVDLLEDVLAERPIDAAAVCGPPAMMPAVARRLVGRWNVPAASIQIAIERQMKCGLGTCGRCWVGSRYACRDGPVFTLAELAALDPSFRDATASACAVTGGLRC